MSPLLSLVLLQAAVPISGTVTYRERFAVPNDSTVEVTLLRGGRTAATLTMPTDGRQVPFEFAFARPRGEGELTLTARIRSAGRTFFATAAPVRVLRGRPTPVRVVRARGDSVLEGRRWTLVSMEGGEIGERPPTIEFLPSGVVTGFAGVNRFSGTRSGAWPAIRIDPGAMTKMAGTEAQNRVEQTFTRLLREVDGADVNGETLTLWSLGRAVLRFRGNPDR